MELVSGFGADETSEPFRFLRGGHGRDCQLRLEASCIGVLDLGGSGYSCFFNYSRGTLPLGAQRSLEFLINILWTQFFTADAAGKAPNLFYIYDPWVVRRDLPNRVVDPWKNSYPERIRKDSQFHVTALLTGKFYGKCWAQSRSWQLGTEVPG